MGAAKRKTPPGEELDEVPALTPSTSTASRPSSNASTSRPASNNGDAKEMMGTNTSPSGKVAKPRRISIAGTTGSANGAPGPAPPRRRSIAPATARPLAAAPAPPPAPSGLPAPPAVSSVSSASAANGATAASKPAPAASATSTASSATEQTSMALPQSLIVPESLHARLQHAAFPHAINLVPAPSASTSVMAGAPPKGTVVLGQVLHPSSGVISAPLHSTGNTSPLNRAAVLAAAERNGVKALFGLPCINALWYIASFVWEGAIPIHGIMDGYSHRLLALRAGESNHPKVVAALFRDTVKAIGCYPARVRAADTETVAWVKERMKGLRGKRPGWFIHGPPESNQHMAPIWSMIGSSQPICALAGALQKHTTDGILDKSCPLDLLAVQVSYLPHLNNALDLVRKEWNKKHLDGCGMSKDGVWAWNIQEWAKRGRYPATEPEGVELPREALAGHSAEEFVNYGATGGPYVPCSINGRDSDVHVATSVQSMGSIPSIATLGSVFGASPTSASPPSVPRIPFAQAPLDDMRDIDPCLRLWLEDFPLPKAMGYAAVRVAMGEFVAEEFAHVATRFKVGRDRMGQ